MQLISCHNGRLFTATRDEHVASERTFVTGLQALDELAPDGRFMRGAIHELLVDPSEGLPRFVAMLFAQAATGLVVGARLVSPSFKLCEEGDTSVAPTDTS